MYIFYFQESEITVGELQESQTQVQRTGPLPITQEIVYAFEEG